MNLQGTSIIGFSRGKATGATLQGFNPVSGTMLEPRYFSASLEEVDRAAKLAASAFPVYSRTSGAKRAEFLSLIANKIEGLGAPLTERATSETGLTVARIQSETGRTCTQLKMFADLVEEGSWVDTRVDRHIRSILRPMGPVAIFCASNFPLAFSVAGGDAVSALASGNPVIVNAHFSHPGTAELIGGVVSAAAKECGLPEGVFSLIYGVSHDNGATLVRHPEIKAVGFTGSRKGGLALMEIARSRPVPIPVFAEMSSINPIFILPDALEKNGEEIARGLFTSVTLGSGQFCTNPGVVVIKDGASAEKFIATMTTLMNESTEFTFLSPSIQKSYIEAVQKRCDTAGVKVLRMKPNTKGCAAFASLFQTDAKTFQSTTALSEEIFGPSTLIVKATSRDEILEVARHIEGQLTSTIHATDAELPENHDLIEILEMKAGRLLIGGFPTGVEVSPAMVHGGPFPSTSDGQSTSVGTAAIFRFVRRVCYQSFPQSMLPDELKF